MGEHANAGTVRSTYEAFAVGDMEAIAATWAPEVRWHEAGNHPLAGDYKGRDEIFGLFGKLMAESGGTFKATLVDVLANDAGDVVALHRATAERNGRTYDAREGLICEFADGLVVSVRHVVGDIDEADAIWS